MPKTESSSNKLHLVMYPCFAFGHLIPYLNLSNKLAQRGHRVTFVLPKGAQSKLEPHNHHPNLIRFVPLVVPHVDGLPVGTETASDAPSPAQLIHICTVYDLCKDQLEDVLKSMNPKPDFVFTDFGYWVPALARPMSIKTVHFSVVPAAILAFFAFGVQLPPSFPSSLVKFKPEEVEILAIQMKEFGQKLAMEIHGRITTSLAESDAISIRTCQEIEGPICDYLAQQYQKPLLLTGPISDGPSAKPLEDKWIQWLSKFEPSSVVFCVFGSQAQLEKDQYQELLLGFESCGHPFLVALVPPRGCSTVEEAFPEGFEERTRGKGWAYGGWVPQSGILNHPSVGCFVNHGGAASMWDSLLCDSQIVLVPHNADHILHARLIVEELKVGVEVERPGENRWVSKERLSNAIQLVMDKTSEVSSTLKNNHANLKNILSRKGLDEEYMDAFVQKLKDMKD